MRRAIPIALLVVALWGWASAQRQPPWGPVPNISGDWYGNGDPNVPCQVIQWRPDGRALFINDHGSRAWATIRGDRVFIPDWSDGSGSPGLWGRIRGDRIVWQNGSFWSRWPMR